MFIIVVAAAVGVPVAFAVCEVGVAVVLGVAALVMVVIVATAVTIIRSAWIRFLFYKISQVAIFAVIYSNQQPMATQLAEKSYPN